MNFEIYPDGQIIKNDLDERLISSLKDLEELLQAVKKTREKILNKQIQEIQDSKKISTSNYCRTGMSLEQIKQYQKIVDVLIIKYNRKMPEPGVKDSMMNDDWRSEQLHLEHYIRLATGKDIKDIE